MKNRCASLLLLLAISIFCFTSCSEEKGSTLHDHGDQLLQATIWAHGTEVFIKHSFPVAGSPADFIIHLSSIKTGQPLSPENQTLIFESEEQTAVRLDLANKEQDGIFHEQVTIPEAGHWKVSLLEDGHSLYLFSFDVHSNLEEAEKAIHAHEHSHAEAAHVDEKAHNHVAEKHDHGDGSHSHEGEAHEHSHQEADHDHEAEKTHSDSSHQHQAHRHSDHAPEGISLTKEQQWKLGVVTSVAGRQTLVKRINLPAKVISPPGSRAVILPPAAGRIFPPEGKPYPSVGEKVVKGQLLAMLQAPVSGSEVFQLENLKAELAIKLAEAEAEEIKAKAALKQVEQAHSRVKKLFERSAKSQRELEESQADLDAAIARYEAATASRNAHQDSLNSLKMNKAQLGNLKGYPKVPITAPINGVLSEVNPAMGEHVLPEHSLFTIIEPSRIYIEGRLNESDLLQIKREPDATFLMPGSKRDYPRIIAGGLGRLLRIGLEVDPTTRTVPITYSLENPGKVLKTGMMLTLCVEGKTSESCVAIPESAIVDMEGKPTAFVQLAGEVFIKRDLVLGIKDGGLVQIIGGIKAGERVVTSNAYSVRLASANTSEIGHGHVH
jgi:RND family efflux transporter MFP subunit